MYPHRIRLRGPWECEPLARTVRHADGRVETAVGSVPAPLRMTMPCRWGEGGLPNFAGLVRFRRRFGVPRRLDPHEHVWLTFAGADRVAETWLNGSHLGRHEGATEPFEFEVTALLQERNELLVEVLASDGNGGLWGEVALEVRRSAFLHGTRLWATYSGQTASLHAAGEVAGTAERPLELYMILDRSTVAYASGVLPGHPFHVVSEELAAERWHAQPCTVRVELVDGASVWYADEQTFDFRRT